MLVLLLALTAGAALVYGITYVTTTRRPARTISDPTFERTADQVCVRTLPKLRATRPASGTSTAKSLGDLADRVEQVSTALTQVEAKLRQVPVLPQYRAKVDAWLHEWDVYIAVGHRYATAIRTGNQKKYTAVGDEGNAPVHAIARFARANHIDDCVV